MVGGATSLVVAKLNFSDFKQGSKHSEDYKLTKDSSLMKIEIRR